MWRRGVFEFAGAVKRVELSGADLAWRAGVVTLCVVLVTAASSSIGSYFSGMFAFFPVAMGSFFIILHPRIGGPAAASVAAHVLTPLIGLGLGLLAVHLLAVPIGVWWSYAVGTGIGLGWNALLWGCACSASSTRNPSSNALICNAQIARKNTALREASGGEPEAGLRGAPPHVAQLAALVESPDRADAVGDVVAEIGRAVSCWFL